MSNSSRPHGLQHASLPCLSLFARVWSNSCPLNPWCHPTISFSFTFVIRKIFQTVGLMVKVWQEIGKIADFPFLIWNLPLNFNLPWRKYKKKNKKFGKCDHIFSYLFRQHHESFECGLRMSHQLPFHIKMILRWLRQCLQI